MSTMDKDHYYAEMLGMMREQGRKDNPIILQLGVMRSENSVKINDLTLYAEDLYIASTTFNEGLKKGDLVAVQKLLDTNRYVILAKVVEA